MPCFPCEICCSWSKLAGAGVAPGSGRRWGGVGAQPADATPPLPPSLPVGRQESGHLLCKLSDDNHHLMAPQRQRGPCVQRLWPLLQAAQCRSARLARPASRGTAALRAAASSVAWLGKPPRAPEGLPTRRASWLAGWEDGRGRGRWVEDSGISALGWG